MTIARLHRGVTLADVLVHEAGHAVAAWELGVRIGAIHVYVRVREGRVTFASDVGLGRFPAGSDALRLAIEREMIVFHAGLIAQKRFHYEGAGGLVPRTDYEGILASAQLVESDHRLIDEWSDYAEEQARALIERPQTWRRVEALAVELARRPVLYGEEIETFLGGVRVPRTGNARRAYRRREAKERFCLTHDPEDREPVERAIAAVRRGRP
ncbi:MAG TPA: hypothetical protein VNI54_04660 [Thermoanaerobaculia bacterium]|nr:hypothetical protein [Thermoanaerobaculia bacterium]